MDEVSIGNRRTLLKGIASLGVASLTGCSSDPPTYGNVLRMGDWLTYQTQRLLLPRQSLAREYELSDISSTLAIGSIDPGNPDKSYFSPEFGPKYASLRKSEFADWRLRVEGAVLNPREFTLTELKRLPRRTQITKHTCEEGWSAISQWTGVPLAAVLRAAGTRPSARYVQFYPYDDVADGIDMIDALHPQTILAYGMNGADLPIAHGAPLRLRVERQLGYKSMKFLRRIVVTDEFDDHGSQGWLRNGWSWYVGI